MYKKRKKKRNRPNMKIKLTSKTWHKGEVLTELESGICLFELVCLSDQWKIGQVFETF